MWNIDMTVIIDLLNNSIIGKVIMAFIVLIIGFFIAKLISKIIVKVLSKVTFIDRFFEILEVNVDSKKIIRVFGLVIYYLILLTVIITALEILGLDSVKSSLEGLQAKYIPALLASFSALALAWVVATIVKLLISKGFKSAHIDEKLNSELSDGGDSNMAIGDTLANAAYWFIFLFFLPRILDPLGFGDMMAPINDITDTMIGYVPNIITAGVLFLVGFIIAKIVKKVVTNLLSAAGADKAGEKIGMKGLSNLAGTLIFVMILFPIVVQALTALQIDAISVPATNILNTILAAVPNVLLASIILGVSYFIWKLVCGIVSDILKGAGFDKILKKMGFKIETTTSLSDVVGKLILAFIMLFATIEATNTLGFAMLSDIVAQFVEFGGKILAGGIVIGVGAYIANIVGDVVKATSKSKAMPKFAKGGVLTLAIAMGLKQMGIADDIINLAFGLSLGAIAISFALAFGLGSREVAAKHLDKWLSNIK